MSLNIFGNVCSQRSSMSSANCRCFSVGGILVVIAMRIKSQVVQQGMLSTVSGKQQNKELFKYCIIGAEWVGCCTYMAGYGDGSAG